MGGGGQEAITTQVHTSSLSGPHPQIPCLLPQLLAGLCMRPCPPGCQLRLCLPAPPQVTHVLDPVDLRRGLGGGFTGQGHSTTRSHCSAFRLHHQLDLWRHRLRGWGGMRLRVTPLCSPVAILPEGTHPPLGSPWTLGWMGAVCRALRRGRPGLKLQEKEGWGAPPCAGVTVSSDWSVKSPVSGCLLVSSFTDTPKVEGEAGVPGRVGEGSEKGSWEGKLGTHLCHQVSGASRLSAS